jgi:hypothetical protein
MSSLEDNLSTYWRVLQGFSEVFHKVSSVADTKTQSPRGSAKVSALDTNDYHLD